jgi:hypothetical protein
MPSSYFVRNYYTSCEDVARQNPFATNGVYTRPTGQRMFCAFDGNGAQLISGDGRSQDNPAISCRFIATHFDSSRQMQPFFLVSDGIVFQTICDNINAGGGWTLLVTSRTQTWTRALVFQRGSASTTVNQRKRKEARS